MQHYVSWQYLAGLKFVVLGRAHQASNIFQRIVKNESNHGLALYRLGWLAKNLGDTARSGILLEQVLARSPKILEAGITLTELFLQSNMANEALNVLEIVGQHHPGALTPWVLRVRILLAVGNINMAAEIAEQLKQQRPDDPEILLLYAECEQAAGRYDGAKAQLLQMVSRVEFSQKAQAYLQLAQIAQQQGGRQNIEQAVSFYEQSDQFGRLDPKTRFQLIQLKWQVGQHNSAAEHFKGIGEDTDINVLLAAAVWGHERDMAHSKILSRWARLSTANSTLYSQVDSILNQAGL
jgi:tetratricopeptide (TPR) repeat protein